MFLLEINLWFKRLFFLVIDSRRLYLWSLIPFSFLHCISFVYSSWFVSLFATNIVCFKEFWCRLSIRGGKEEKKYRNQSPFSDLWLFAPLSCFYRERIKEIMGSFHTEKKKKKKLKRVYDRQNSGIDKYRILPDWCPRIRK